uniref:NADH dehydrogenase subunit 4 n=1 Tax=Pyxicephalus adspersus TaxID=30357 RepID=A0AAV2ZM27_PYXAD|nr:TPA: hypothetical protein GDO54_004079 [Pyxicephalus adspersus]
MFSIYSPLPNLLEPDSLSSIPSASTTFILLHCIMKPSILLLFLLSKTIGLPPRFVRNRQLSYFFPIATLLLLLLLLITPLRH